MEAPLMSEMMTVSFDAVTRIYHFDLRLPITGGGYGDFSVGITQTDYDSFEDTQALRAYIKRHLPPYAIMNEIKELSMEDINALLLSALEGLLGVTTVQEAKGMLAFIDKPSAMSSDENARLGKAALQAYITAKGASNGS